MNQENEVTRFECSAWLLAGLGAGDPGGFRRAGSTDRSPTVGQPRWLDDVADSPRLYQPHRRYFGSDINADESLVDDARDAAFSAAEQGAPQKITLDFTHVDYINSTGIALIVGLLGRCRAAHRPIAAAGLSEHYRQIFELTRLNEAIGIYDNEMAAKTAVNGEYFKPCAG